MKLSNVCQPTCSSSSGDVLHVYMYITFPDAGTLLSHLNIAIMCVCVCVYVCVCVCVCMYVLCMYVCANLYVTSCFFLSICEHTDLCLPSFHYVCYEQCVKHYSG